jgi:uncharacterized protein YkwD
MKKITALGMIAITIAANIAPMQANAAGVGSYYQCPGGNNATVISGNSLSDIQSKLQGLGINPDSINSANVGNSQNCPTNAGQVKSANVGNSQNCPTSTGQVKSANVDSNCALSQDCVTNGCVGNQCTTNQCTSQCTTSQCTKNLCPSSQCPTTKAPEKSVNTTTETKQTQAAPVKQESNTQAAVTKTATNKTETANKTATTTATTTNNTTAVTTTNKENLKNSAYVEQVVKLVNIERAKEGLAPLTVDNNVEKAAMVRANEIQTQFAHVRPNGTGFVTALKEAGAVYRGAGENIAWGQKTPEEVVAGWMNSPGHRANIMNKNYVNIGVGNLQDSSGTQYWVQIFTY